jgi:long-subunit fatty acid transport protein
MIEKTVHLKVGMGTRSVSWLGAFVICGLVFFGSAGRVQAEKRLGNYGAVAIDAETRLRYSSNVFRNSNEQDDRILELTPRLRYRFDQGSIRVEADAGVNVIRYDDFNANDAEDIKSHIVIEFPYGDYQERKRYDIRSGVEFLDQDSETAGFSDIQRLSVPIEFFYDYRETLSLGLGYRYVQTDVERSITTADSTDHAVFLAVEGQLASAVNAELRLGGQRREFDAAGEDDDNGFFVESLFSWEASDLTTVDLSIGNQFSTTLDRISKETFFAEVELKHRFSDKIRATAGLGYEDVTYSNGRDDEQFSLEVGSVYTLIEKRLEVDCGARYAHRDSSRVSSNYDVLMLHASLSYLF